jgi:hypothetical protein
MKAKKAKVLAIDDTETVRVRKRVKRKVEKLVFDMKKAGEKISVGKWFEIAAEERLKNIK